MPGIVEPDGDHVELSKTAKINGVSAGVANGKMAGDGTVGGTASDDKTKPEKVRDPITNEEIEKVFKNHFTNDKPGITRFFPEVAKVEDYVEDGVKMANKLLEMGCTSREAATMLPLLMLYDLVMLIDDSLSMETKQNVELPDGSRKPIRKEALRCCLSHIAEVYTLARPDGIFAIEFLNSLEAEGDVLQKHVDEIINEHTFSGCTRIGSQMEHNILSEFIPHLERPLLVITITDGDIDGEDDNVLINVIQNCIDTLDAKNEQGSDVVAFQFAQVGDDAGARDLLKRLDDDERVGEYIDTLDGKIEDIEDPKKRWNTLPKLLLGGFSSSWDNQQDIHVEMNREMGTSIKPTGPKTRRRRVR